MKTLINIPIQDQYFYEFHDQNCHEAAIPQFQDLRSLQENSPPDTIFRVIYFH